MKKTASIILGLTLIVVLTSAGNSFFELSKQLDIFGALFKEVNNVYVDETEPSKLMRSCLDKNKDEIRFALTEILECFYSLVFILENILLKKEEDYQFVYKCINALESEKERQNEQSRKRTRKYNIKD